MGQVIISGSGGAGVTSDDATAIAKHVVKGKTYMGADTDDEIGTGTLELTGGATDAHVLEGDTFYTDDPYTKHTGRMANIAAIDPMKSMTMSGGTVYVRISNGAHITNASSGYPEVSIDGSNFGDAIDAYVYNGKTYTCSTGIKRTGKMIVSSVVSFNVAAYSTSQVICTWQNPAKGPYSGIAICAKAGGYPTSIFDSRVYTGVGSNSALSGTSSAIIGGLTAGTTYYFRIWVYCNTSVGDLYSGYMQAVCMPTAHGRKVYTSSGTFTVPNGIRSINVHCTGGGGAGGYGAKSTTGNGGHGGGGGYTSYKTNIAVNPGSVYEVIIGSGGVVNSANSGLSGSASSFGTIVSANGGCGGNTYPSVASGGSGGGQGALYTNNIYAGNGGSDGSNGYVSHNVLSTSEKHRIGQGTTTREFGSSAGTLYSGGGAGGTRYVNYAETYRAFGGAGGGGNGTYQNSAPVSGSHGSGGGGGGGGREVLPMTYAGAAGGCGNVIITW